VVTFENRLNTNSLQAVFQNEGRPSPKPLRGAMRLLHALGHGALAEFPLKSGRRADILSLGQQGEIWIVEVKSGIPDFRSDHKWQDYLEWCDRFFFAVGPDFPVDVLPPFAGLLIADEYHGLLVREPEPTRLVGSRRKALTLRFAHLAARRLSGREDPIAG